jgi:exosortase B
VNGGAPSLSPPSPGSDEVSRRAGAQPAPEIAWLIALAGFAAMYVPVYWWASHTVWTTDEQAHGPLILGVMVWLFWLIRQPLLRLSTRPDPWLGTPLFVVGLVVYVLGRVFSISIFEFSSQIFVVAGVLLLLRGRQALRLAWFPVLYLVFMVPLPGFFVDTITGPLKEWISIIVETTLYAWGYPIARTGVMMTIGPYQLLVADACSGLNSMFSLAAVGTLFMYVKARLNPWHNLIMLCAILPIAFVANVIRVVVLVLLTFHFGDEVGQGFLHSTAGILLMLVSIGILFSMDFVLTKLFFRTSEKHV